MNKPSDDLMIPSISVCIVTYNSTSMLKECLVSLTNNTTLPYEIVIADNGSQDNIRSMLQADFPTAQLIENPTNLGYTRPMNQALRQSQGRYLMQLNPDTLVLPGALDKMVAFLENHPDTGIVGPKVLNRDRTLQKSCRRGEPTPLAVFSYFLGLSKLFPRSKLFGQYQLNYLDENLTHPVAGVAGSCMLIRRQLIERIGYLDEQFFAYQEDADFCHRARNAGWKVIYYPESQIIHFGGQGGSMVEPQRAIVAWHKSYYLYYKKHLAKNYFFLFNWFYYLAMFIKLSLTLIINFFRKEKFINTRRP
jgi:GT2 family glycosyltransferase